MPYGRRVDANQQEVVRVLRTAPGVSVAVTSMLGKGYPDLNVGWKERSFHYELKDPSQPASKRKLTPDEQEWHAKWTGHVEVVTTADEIFDSLYTHTGERPCPKDQ